MTVRVSPEKDYYKILGVEKNANAQTIKKKFRALAREHHPDKNKGSKKAEEKFKLFSEAYEVLGDAKKRKSYDRMQATGGGRRPTSRGGNTAYSDPFDFGRQYQRRGPREDQQDPFSRPGSQEEPQFDPDMPTRGFDLQFMLDVPFVTACLGGTIKYSYDKHVPCVMCNSRGTNEDGDSCGVCEGATRTIENTTVNIEIPPGVKDQYTLRMAEQGGAGRNGGPPGDLLIKVCIVPHPKFKRVKSDVYGEVLISQELADEGGTIEVDTLESKRTIEVEDGTLTGEDYRIPEAGSFEPWSKKRGDLILKFRIED